MSVHEWTWVNTGVSKNALQCTLIKLSVDILGFVYYADLWVTENKLIILFNFNKDFEKVYPKIW